jgi:hypothetical protein
MPGSIKLVIFDPAGTTIKDAGQVPDTYAGVLRAHGIEAAGETIRSVQLMPGAADCFAWLAGGGSRLPSIPGSTGIHRTGPAPGTL